MYKYSEKYFKLYSLINKLHTVVCRIRLDPKKSNTTLCEIYVDPENNSTVVIRCNKYVNNWGVINESSFEVLCKGKSLEYLSPINDEIYAREEMTLMSYFRRKMNK